MCADKNFNINMLIYNDWQLRVYVKYISNIRIDI